FVSSTLPPDIYSLSLHDALPILHDRVLLDDADEHHEADEGIDVQLVAEEIQRDDRAETGRRKPRQNRERVDVALVQHAQHDVDRSEEHTSELQSPDHLVCRLLLE